MNKNAGNKHAGAEPAGTGEAANEQPALRIDPPAFLHDPALLAVLDALPDSRVVGGAVRDALSGRPVADIDLATRLLPEQVIAALDRAGIRPVPTGIAHGTVTAVVDHRGFEVTTLRHDLETDGRHAVVAFTADWRADAARRDFTINAMSMDRGGAVFDYFGGIADLRQGAVRFVGIPAARIAEDYLRILRYFRFYARYAGGPADAATRAALRGGVPGLARLAPERVWTELLRILAAPDPTAAVALMAELGVLAAILPEGADPTRLARLVACGAPSDPLLRLAALLTGDPAPLALRLRLSVADRDRLLALRPSPTRLSQTGASPADPSSARPTSTHPTSARPSSAHPSSAHPSSAHPSPAHPTSAPRPTDDCAALRRAMADTPPRVLIDRTWLAGDDGPDWAALRARLAGAPRPVFPLEGRDVLALGLRPGPAIGLLLREVRGWWLDGGCVADVAACRLELQRRAAARSCATGPPPRNAC